MSAKRLVVDAYIYIYMYTCMLHIHIYIYIHDCTYIYIYIYIYSATYTTYYNWVSNVRAPADGFQGLLVNTIHPEAKIDSLVYFRTLNPKP